MVDSLAATVSSKFLIRLSAKYIHITYILRWKQVEISILSHIHTSIKIEHASTSYLLNTQYPFHL